MSNFLKRYRDSEGQLELFDEPTQPRRFHAFPILVVLLIALGLWGISKAKAEQFQAEGVFCQSKETITEFINRWTGNNAQETVEAINKESGTMSCIGGLVVLEEVARTDILERKTGMWQMVEIKVHQIQMGGVAILFPEPQTHFTFIQVTKEEVGQAI